MRTPFRGFTAILYKEFLVVLRDPATLFFMIFPPLILAINILEACARDIQVGMQYWMMNSGAIEGEVTGVLGGPWNFMNAAAGILNIITITGWFGIVIRRKTKQDGSRDMLWPDMLWFWVIAYDLWNFTYTYNCIPTHAFYAGFALLLAAWARSGARRASKRAGATYCSSSRPLLSKTRSRPLAG